MRRSRLPRDTREALLYIVERTVGRDWLGEMRKKIDSARDRAQYARWYAKGHLRTS